MKKILVPCDFSKPAVNAYRFALDVASRCNGSVHLVNVVELPVLHDAVLMPVLNFEDKLLEDLRENSADHFRKLIARYGANNVVVTWEVTFGPTSRKILDTIDEKSIDLVVMGSHGASGFREMFVGSNAEKIVRHSPAPVLVLKDYYKGHMKNIVFPTGFDIDDQEALVVRVRELQQLFQAHLHLVWINTPANFASDLVSYVKLRDFADRFQLKDFTVHVFNHLQTEEGIQHFAQLMDADLIAMGTHGRTGLSHLINGSLTEDLVNHTTFPVWTYNAIKEHAEA